MTNGLKDEHYRVRKLRCPLSGIVAEELWETPEGALHNPDGPAIICRDRENGIVTRIGYYLNGDPHRSNGDPACEEFDPETGRCNFRLFAVAGEYDRPDQLPHVEFVDAGTGRVYRAEYRVFGTKGSLLHRADGPALITYDRQTGALTSATFYRHGRKQSGAAPPPPSAE